MRVQIDPTAEWKQMFNEVWRQERDYFYAAAMNGVDWEKMHDKYAQLLPVRLRPLQPDLHPGRDDRRTLQLPHLRGRRRLSRFPSVKVGLLGADFEADASSACIAFKKIYAGENWDAQTRSPLTEPGVNVKEGDYLIAVNGRPLRAPQSPYELFTNTVNETVTLTINSKPSEDGSRTVQVKPIADEYSLRELNWIESNRKKVDAATNGRVGYVYLPDMGGDGSEPIRQTILPADPKRRYDHRRPLQRRRLRGSTHFRAPAPGAGRHGLQPQLGEQHRAARWFQRRHGLRNQPLRCLRRRYLQLLL